MMAGNAPRELYIRTAGVTNEEDRIALSVGAPMALRTWMHDRPERLSEVALQLGFELWKRDGKELPPCSGVLSRPVGMPEEDRARGVAAAAELADRVFDIYADGGPAKSAGVRVNELFLFVQWRIARLARMRAEREDRAGNTELAMKDVDLSDRLDQLNSALERILLDMDKARERTLRSVTPRESLQMALARADFALARRFAEPILKGDPDDPNANFGVGMSYFTQKQWTRSEEFLRKCLIKKPNEPAIWNNLAMICLYTERYDEGLKLANKALELIPESAEVKDTIKQIREAQEKAKEAAAKAKAAGKPADARTPSAPANAPARGAESNAPSAAGAASDAYAVFAVGMAHFGKEEWDAAVEQFARCVAQKPEEPTFLSYLSKALFRKGKYDDALKHAQKALKLQPDSKDLKETIRQIEKARDDAKVEKKPARKPEAKKAERKQESKKSEKKPEAKKGERKPEAKKPQAKKAEKPPKAVEKPVDDIPEPPDLEGLVPVTPTPASDPM